MCPIRALLCGLLVLVLGACQSFPTAGAGTSAPARLDRIIESGQLRVGLSGNQPPLNMKNRAGEIIGLEEMEKEVAEGTTAGRIFEELVDEYPKLSSYGKVIQIAINQEFADRQREVVSEDEVAFLPPVSGG